jgi:hypothetical protein
MSSFCVDVSLFSPKELANIDDEINTTTAAITTAALLFISL